MDAPRTPPRPPRLIPGAATEPPALAGGLLRRGRWRRFRRCRRAPGLPARILSTVLLIGTLTATSQTVALQLPRGSALTESLAHGGLIPPSDAEAERWLKRAEQAALRGDWKLAADTLARLIEEHGHKTVSPDGGQRFYSALRCAQDQIASWPPEGIAAYRRLHDSDVRRRLEEAKRDHDLDELRAIARRFPMTTPGPEAMDLLASRLLDRRRGGEAIDLLDRLTGLPHNTLPRWQILQKLAIAYAVEGRYSGAADTIERMHEIGELPPIAAGKAEDRRAALSRRPLPADWSERIAAIRRFVEGRDSGGDVKRGDLPVSWPQLLGPAEATGIMPAIDAAVTPDAVLRDGLPGADRIEPRLIGDLIERTGRPVVWQAVSDGRSLFLTCPAGLIARDLTTFEFLWQAVGKIRRRDPRIVRHRLETGIWDVDNVGNLDELSTHTLFHEYRGAVTTAFGLVFIVEQVDTPGERFPTRRGVVPLNEVVPAEAYSVANSLRAYEADTGRAVWTRGRGGPIGDALKDAHFYAPPIVAGSCLVAPCLQDKDFFLAVLKPDGTLLERVLIGSGRAGVLPMNAVLPPTVRDGTVYVQTGAGLLVALNAFDFSLRWLARYERADILNLTSRRRRQMGQTEAIVLVQADGWLASPPLVAGGSVLLAAHDSEHLVAFDPRSGAAQWAFPRGEHRYVVGADSRCVVIAGKQVSAVSLETGKLAWTFDGGRPTGRPAICGGRVLVPVGHELITLDLQTGREVDERLASAAPLGNLLAIDGALYSLGAGEIARFSDVQRSREAALARRAEDPDDLDALLRLAWLAVLGKDWPQASKWVDEVDRRRRLSTSGAPPAARTRQIPAQILDPDIHARLPHLRVTVLLHLAAQSSLGERAALLKRALEAAHRPSDKIKAGLRLCDCLTRQREPSSAFRLVLGLLRDVGDEPIALAHVEAERQGQSSPDAAAGETTANAPTTSHLHVRSEVLIANRLRRLWTDHMTESQRAETTAHVQAMIDPAMAADQLDTLVRLADGLGFADPGARLDLYLGKRALAEGAPESGVFHLTRVAERAPEAELGLEALIRLAMAFARPGDELPAAPAEAARVLRLLDAGYGGRPLPPRLAELAVRLSTTSEHRPRESSAPPQTIGDVVGLIRAVLPGGLFEDSRPRPEILSGLGRLRLLDEETSQSARGEPVAAFHDPTQDQDIYADVVPIGVSGQVKGLSVNPAFHERVYWSSEFDPLGQHRTDAAPDAAGGLLHQAGVAAMIGRIAAVHVGRQIHAVGLTSGRTLWPPMPVDFDSDRPPDPPALAISGIIVAGADSRTLVAMRAREDARPLWRRRFPALPLGILADVGGELVVIDRDATTVFVLDPVSGRTLRQFALRPNPDLSAPGPSRGDPVPANMPSDVPDHAAGGARASAGAHVAIVGDIVCRTAEKGIIARSLADGTVLWDLPRVGPEDDIRALDDRHVGISHHRGQFLIVRTDTGETVMDITMEGLVMPPLDATLDGNDRLLVFAATAEDTPELVLRSIPLGESGDRWERRLGRFARISRRMMRASPGYVAVVQFLGGRVLPIQGARQPTPPPPVSQTPSAFDRALLLVFDKATGTRLIPRPYEFPRLARDARPGPPTAERGRSDAITDVLVLDRRIIAVAPGGYYVLGKTEAGPDAPDTRETP